MEAPACICQTEEWANPEANGCRSDWKVVFTLVLTYGLHQEERWGHKAMCGLPEVEPGHSKRCLPVALYLNVSGQPGWGHLVLDPGFPIWILADHSQRRRSMQDSLCNLYWSSVRVCDNADGSLQCTHYFWDVYGTHPLWTTMDNPLETWITLSSLPRWFKRRCQGWMKFSCTWARLGLIIIIMTFLYSALPHNMLLALYI